MKRFFLVVCIFVTLALVSLFIFHKFRRAAINNHKANHIKFSQHAQNELAQAGNFLSQVQTRPVSLEEFNQILLKQAETNLDNLSESERAKLLACISRFYSCYSSGKFDDYKQFRLLPPFAVSENIVSFVKEKSATKGIGLKSDEEILRAAWDFFNGTNKITQIDEENIRLSVVTKSDLGIELRTISDANKWPAINSATCEEGSVLYQPALADLLKKDGAIRYFTLEIKARFNSVADGPAIPMVLQGYWDSTREDWMPNCLCFWISISPYHTFFKLSRGE